MDGATISKVKEEYTQERERESFCFLSSGMLQKERERVSMFKCVLKGQRGKRERGRERESARTRERKRKREREERV